MPKDHTALVLARRDYGSAAYRLDLEAPELAAEIQPGQFFMIAIPGGGRDPLLRRPFGYLSRDRAAGRLSVLVQKVGRGTWNLGEVLPGRELRVLGPLGRGWTPPERGPVLLAAGGVGVAPLYDLAIESARKVETTLIYGARCGEDLYLREDLAKLPLELVLATDNGDCGRRGTVVDALRGLDAARFVRYYGCGPRPMLSSLRSCMDAAGVEGELSLEERMACGFGACLGCAVAVRLPDGGTTFKRVCADGPVFPAEEVVFNANA